MEVKDNSRSSALRTVGWTAVLALWVIWWTVLVVFIISGIKSAGGQLLVFGTGLTVLFSVGFLIAWRMYKAAL